MTNFHNDNERLAFGADVLVNGLDLVLDPTGLLSRCETVTQETMVWHFSQCDDEFGRRLAETLGLDHDVVKA
ncbi:hypothetical protein GCM10010399_62210 [Dactylosporangium fulvum]|uniref:Uncharacterized protein n=1 Tax=Dactylosporangium fulvum TaxID=53359 RepID=A0ABY5W7L6_9ACTN|nr:hypothetical protein [Dactylosporangium fulvum]UWP84688.1 hypothetical protein Dfulv_10815 [Dactylosporangium fulvum]